MNHLTCSLPSVLAGAKRSDSAALHLLPSTATSLRRPATGERSRRYRDIDEARQRQPGRDMRRPRPTPNIRHVRLRVLGRLGDLEHAVAFVLKRLAARAGLDPREVAGHSLRAGLATSAAAVGVPSASSPYRRDTGARPCFAATSGRDRCSVRTPPARWGCRGGSVAGRRVEHGRVVRGLLALSDKGGQSGWFRPNISTGTSRTAAYGGARGLVPPAWLASARHALAGDPRR